MNWTQKILKEAIEKRALDISKILSPHIRDKEKVLDFGCGDMKIASFIESEKGCDITGLDTVDYNLTDKKLVKYSGGKIPFKKDFFDVSLCIYVLHHTDNPEYYLDELIRVSKKRIVIAENIFYNPIQKVFVDVIDKIGNWFESPEIEVPCNFKRDEEWKNLFEEKGLKLVVDNKITSRFCPSFIVPHKLYVLEKS